MDECAAKYMLACIDPWGPGAIGACIPTSPNRPSYKHTAYKKATITVGNGGYGFCIVSPCLANNAVAYWTTTDTFAGSTANVSLDTPQLGTVAGNMTSLPFAQNDFIDISPGTFRPAIRGRIVSVSASVYYTGTELNRGGRTVCFASPDHSSVNEASFSTILSYREASEEPTPQDRSKCTVMTYSIDPTEKEYPDFPAGSAEALQVIQSCYPLSAQSALSTVGVVDQYTGQPVMVIWVQSAPQTTWAVDIIQHSEFIGPKADPMLTPNNISTTGVALVETALGDLPMMKTARPGVSMRKLAREALVKAAKAVTSKAAVRAGKQLLLAGLS